MIEAIIADLLLGFAGGILGAMFVLRISAKKAEKELNKLMKSLKGIDIEYTYEFQRKS